MKKILLAALLISMLPLTACTKFETGPLNKGEPLEKSTAEHKIYLVLTKNGLYKGEKGEANDDLFLENAITYTEAVGEPLPTAEDVTNTVEGVTFKGWISYENKGTPTIFTTVPMADGKILYASWEGGSGTVTPTEESDWYVVGKGSFVESEWNFDGGVNLLDNTANTQDVSATGEYTNTIKFAKGDLWKIANKVSGVWVQMSCLDQSCPVIAQKKMKFSSDGNGGYNCEIVEAGSYTLYFKTYAGANQQGTSGYSLWVEEA